MNRISELFQHKKNNILSVYFTAGHPTLDSTVLIIKALAEAGADMIEIGMPFSDPMADGPVIQSSSSIALQNGMSLRLLFQHLTNIRNEVDIPLILMGYLNPVLQYGIDHFCRDCSSTGIDGVILPDLPLSAYKEEYKKSFEKFGLYKVFLVSPHTHEERLMELDEESSGFLYFVSSSSTTGIKGGFDTEQLDYFKRIGAMKLKNPPMVGFGISNHESFTTVCRYSRGGIIGSAFVKMLAESKDLKRDIKGFVKQIRDGKD